MRSLWILALLLLAPLGAQADSGWRAAFPSGAVRAQLPATAEAALVSSSLAPEAARAAAALREALVGEGLRRVALASPRDTLTDDAARIAWTVRRAADEIVLYVRVERDAHGTPSAVVSIFDASGASIGAFVASAAEPLRAPRGALPAEGLGRAAVARVDEVLTGSSTTPAATLAPPRVVIPRDAAGHLELDEAYAQYPGPAGGHAYREALPGEQLYQALGRSDWADAYVTRRRLRYGFIASGAVILGLGLLTAGSMTLASGISYSADPSDHERSMLLGSGIALGVTVGVGVAFILGGKLTSRHPIAPGRVARAAERHQAALSGGLVGGAR
jgi:hypothetical protein